MVLYFSGTGNSRYVAETIGAILGDEVISMNERIKCDDKAIISSQSPLVFVAPVYAGRIPRIVEKHILETRFDGNKNAYFVSTCATTPWITGSYTEKICKQKSFHSLGFHSVIMPQNYVTHSDILTESENDKIIEDAMPKIREIAKTINAGIPLPKEEPGKSLMSKVLNPIMYATMISAKGFYTTDDCDHCGQCVKRCPLNNITMENEKPQWGKDCTHCMACIDGCPKKSIENGKATLGRNRYYNTKTPQL